MVRTGQPAGQGRLYEVAVPAAGPDGAALVSVLSAVPRDFLTVLTEVEKKKTSEGGS